jgi:predicted SprT family Zn-dependent metalloprotease
MRLFEQLDLFRGLRLAVGEAVGFPSLKKQKKPTASPTTSGRDPALEALARELLRAQGAETLALRVRVEWNRRLRTAAGRAAFHLALVSLNPRLREHGADEIDRTLRHELAHLLAHHRCGRRRISPHGPEWRRACRDLGIADEQRCHTLPFERARRQRRLIYRCPHCAAEFPRVRRIRPAVACLACCRTHNAGKFAREFQLRLVRSIEAA